MTIQGNGETIYWAKFSPDGFPAAFYPSDIWNEQPDDTIEIARDQWLEFINNQGLRVWNNGAIEVYVPPSQPVVYIVSQTQARIALFNAGLLATVENAIAAKGGPIQIKWEYSTTIRSDDPDLIAIASDLGISGQIPTLFAAAENL